MSINRQNVAGLTFLCIHPLVAPPRAPLTGRLLLLGTDILPASVVYAMESSLGGREGCDAAQACGHRAFMDPTAIVLYGT